MTEDEMRLRHLDTIQSIINRLAQNSFAIRGWSVTVVTVVFALVGARESTVHNLVLISLLPAAIFWGLDAYYVREERRFRALYRAAAHRLLDGDGAPEVAPFNMDVRPWSGPATAAWRVMLAPNVATIPGMLMTIVIAYWSLAA